MGARLRFLAAAAFAVALAVGTGGVAGARAEESRAPSARVPVLEGKIEQQEARLEERVEELAAVGAGLERVQARASVAQSRVEELRGQSARLEGELTAHRESFEAARVDYEERVRAAYKGDDLDGIAASLAGVLGSRGAPAAVAGPAGVLGLLTEGRESLEAYRENDQTLRKTSRRVSATTREYEEAVAQKRALAADLRAREAELDAAIASISGDTERLQERLRGLRAEERRRALESVPATSAGGADSSVELRVAREKIVARPVQPVSGEEYTQLYRSAAREYGFARDWYVLAAVGYVESNHGETLGPSTAGALGPMQFLPSTWETAGVDGDGDGVANIMDPEDAIPAAAGYLSSGGAPEDWYRALFTYNHADWYVKKVLGVAEAYRRLDGGGEGTHPYI